MGKLFDKVDLFFEDEGWAADPVEGVTALRLVYGGKSGSWTCYARVREEQGQITFYSQFPGEVPEARRGAVAELLTRINYGLIVGNFELDLGDGDLRYKTNLDLGAGLDLDDFPQFSSFFGRMIGFNLSMMDRYLPGVVAVLGGASPVEALTAIEGG